MVLAERRMKILVTGAAGFIGSFTASRFLGRGDEVVGLDNLNDYYDVTLKTARLERLQRQPRFRLCAWNLLIKHGSRNYLHARNSSEWCILVRRRVCAIRCRIRTATSAVTWSVH